MLKTHKKWLVDVAQEQRLNDKFAIMSMPFTLKSFLVLLRHSTRVSLIFDYLSTGFL